MDEFNDYGDGNKGEILMRNAECGLRNGKAEVFGYLGFI
jgi:hypothetical protein